MSSLRPFAALSPEEMVLIDRLCDRLEGQWRRGGQVTVEELLGQLPEQLRPQALHELIPIEITCRLSANVPVSLSELLQRFPEVSPSSLADSIEAARRETSAKSALQGAEAVPRDWGPYQLVDVLGRGGMGTVFRAKHRATGDEVAVKLLRAEIAADSEFRRRFVREQQTATKLRHPCIVRALETAEHQGQPGLVMEYVNGVNLEEYVSRQGPLSVDAVIELLQHVGNGLQYAHEQGVIHRDLKPANLLRDLSGQVKILDLGLARQLAPSEQMSMLTRTGMMMGTAAYMSPEQSRDPRSVDPRSDWYSLGCTLFFLLTGKAPFRGANPVQLALAHTQESVPSVRTHRPEVPVTLDGLIQKLMAKQPEDRPAHLQQILKLLDGSARKKVEVLPPPHVTKPVGESGGKAYRYGRRRSKAGSNGWWLSVAGLGGIILGGAIWFFVQPPSVLPAPKPTEPQQTLDVPVQTSPVPIPTPNSIDIWAFNGSSSFAHLPDVVPEAGATYTIEVIVRPEAVQTSNVITWLGPDWMAIYLSGDGRWGVARRFGEQQKIRTANAPVTLHEWVSLAGVFERGDLSLYVNGVLQGGAMTDYPLPEKTGGLYFGGVDPLREPNRFFRGQIRSVRITPGVLSIVPLTTPGLTRSTTAPVVKFDSFNTASVPELLLHNVQRSPFTP